MEMGRPRDDSVVSCDLYTLAVAPLWLLRLFFLFFFGGWRKYMVLLVVGFLITISFCGSGLFFFFLFFPGGFFPAISLGSGCFASQQVSVWFSLVAEDHLLLFLYFRGISHISHTLSPTCLLFCLPHCRLEHSTLLRAFEKEMERIRTATALEEFICHNLSC